MFILSSLLLLALILAVARVSAQPHEKSTERFARITTSQDNEPPTAGYDSTQGRSNVLIKSPASRSVTVTVPARYRGQTAKQWAARYRQRTRQYQNAKRTLMASPTVSEAINLAATVYGNGATLWRKARCESGLDPNAKNGSEASGLFQFLPSTWASTPFRGYSVFSTYANALAAGWMHSVGRGGEWVCR